MTDIVGERSRLRSAGLNHTLREGWGAVQRYTSDRTVVRPARYLFLHISVTAVPASTPASEAAACRTVERIGQDRFDIGCSYNEGVMQSGRLYEMQPLTRRGAHTVNDLVNPRLPSGSLNQLARACVLVQNVQDAVTTKQIDSAARWGAACILAGEVRRDAVWYGHRDVTRKSCPGDKGYAQLARLNQLTRHYVANGVNGEDDMPTEDEILNRMADRLVAGGDKLRTNFASLINGELDKRAWSARPLLVQAEPGGPVYVLEGDRGGKWLIRGWDNVRAMVAFYNVFADGEEAGHPKPWPIPKMLLDEIPEIDAPTVPA